MLNRRHKSVFGAVDKFWRDSEMQSLVYACWEHHCRIQSPFTNSYSPGKGIMVREAGAMMPVLPNSIPLNQEKNRGATQSLKQCRGFQKGSLCIKLKPLFSTWEHIMVHISTSLSTTTWKWTPGWLYMNVRLRSAACSGTTRCAKQQFIATFSSYSR